MKNTNILNPALAATLATYGLSAVSTRNKTAEEAQDGVGSELSNEDSGSSVDTDGIFAPESKLIDFEGGHNIVDGKQSNPDTPSGEKSTFDNYMTGDSGGVEYKKETKEPGYQGASVDSELAIGGSTVDKGAAFLQQVQKFASVQQNFVTKIAVMAKMAEGMMPADPSMAASDPAAMDPQAALAGMAGPGQGSEEMLDDGMGGGEELSPEDEALIEAIIERESSDNPLTPEELSQIQMILGEGGEGGGELPPEAMGAEMGGMPPEAAMGGGEAGLPMEEPALTPEEGKIAHAIVNYKEAEDDEDSSEESEPKEECSSDDSCPSEGSDDSVEIAEPPISSDETAIMADITGDGGLPGDDLGGEGGGVSSDLAAVLDSMSGDELATLFQAVTGGAEDPSSGLESALEEPELGQDELEQSMRLAQAEDEEEYKQASYYGMGIPEFRAARDKYLKEAAEKQEPEKKQEDNTSTSFLKEALLQAKNAEQSKKAKRFGQTIDSLIRK